jgi:hypothetical protein
VRLRGTHSFGFEENCFWPCPRQADLSGFGPLFDQSSLSLPLVYSVHGSPGLDRGTREEEVFACGSSKLEASSEVLAATHPGHSTSCRSIQPFSSRAADTVLSVSRTWTVLKPPLGACVWFK